MIGERVAEFIKTLDANPVKPKGKSTSWLESSMSRQKNNNIVKLSDIKMQLKN